MNTTADVSRICSDLVKIRSDNPPGFTDEVIAYLQEFLDSIGMKTRTVTRGRRHNLISVHPKGKLLLCGHVDVVPALDDGWTYPPYSGVISDGFVHGRGSTDMKGGCAALLAALRSVMNSGGNPEVDVAFVADEEGKGEFGMEQLVEERILVPCDTIIAEPTPPRSPIIGEKGVLRTKVTFSGKSGHASLHPVIGDSAIIQACRYLEFCQTLHEREWNLDPEIMEAIDTTVQSYQENTELSYEDGYRILSRIMYNPGFIEGGERMNVIAQRCDLSLDMRIPWGCNIDEVLSLMHTAAPAANISVLESSEPTFSRPGWLSQLICTGIHSVYQTSAHPGLSQAGSDARYLRSNGAEVVMYGPGDLSLLHSVNERVPVTMLENCQKVYEYVLNQLP
ncbi:MAG: M20/M25/M40 family metallo-hydrolase [Methanospirillum sp.]|uniref:M20/M25/M40 family metallo-hydrolase n=1 Tax=Methanospirillum sp. TaxID=45200 RepID=UPI002375860D|nr:M20/M25/M40 family metallo-hydrolase [Methanospirillum sp.]MDD1729738.1 M20/M25/M40 family metallo-hydrolase [Methanospirillum sp.]